MIDKIIFSKHLKELRSKHNMTMVELANQLNIKKQSVNTWENMKTIPSADKLIELAAVFNVSVNYLVGNGLFAKEELILKNKDKLIESLDFFYKTNFFNKMSVVSDYDFLELMTSVLEDIQFSEDGGESEITLFPRLPAESGEALSKIIE